MLTMCTMAAAAVPRQIEARLAAWAAREDYLEQNAWSFDAPLDRPLQATPDLGRTALEDLKGLVEATLGTDDGSVGIDSSPWCQDFTNIRFLRPRLAEIGFGMRSDPRCPAFEQWADEESLRSIEILFVSPTGRRAAATFGHVLIRLVRQTGDRPRGDDVVYEIVALAGFGNTSLSYVTGGLTGRFPLVFQPTSLRDALSENLRDEQRGMRRFRLNLSPTQRRRVLERLYEVERRAYLPYRFLDQNCATYLQWLLRTALGDELRMPRSTNLVRTPSEVMDELGASTLSRTGAPLMTLLDASFDPSSAEAAASARTRDSAVAEIRERSPLLAAEWAALPQPLTPAFVGLSRRTLEHEADQSGDIVRVAGENLAQARWLLDRARAELKRIEQQRLRPIPGDPLPTVEVLVARRRELYAAPEGAERERLAADNAAWVEHYLRDAPRRPLSAAETGMFRTGERRQREFEAATEVHARTLDLVAEFAPEHDANASPEPEKTNKTRIPAAAARRTLLAFERARGGTFTAIHRTAFWNEELGQERPHGLGPLRSLTLLDAETRIEMTRRLPRWDKTKLRPVAVAVVDAQPGQAQRMVFDRYGWAADVTMVVQREGGDLEALADGVILVRDATRDPWMLGISGGTGPAMRALDHRLRIAAAVRSEVFLRRRLRSTGGWRTSIGWKEGGRETLTAEAGTRVDLPLDTRETIRLNAMASVLCSALVGCSWRFGGGVDF